MDFAARLEALQESIKDIGGNPVFLTEDGADVEMEEEVPSALTWVAERQEALALQSLSSNGLLTETLMRDDTWDTSFDFDIQISSKLEVTRALSELQRLEQDLKREMQSLEAMGIDELTVAPPLVVLPLARHDNTESIKSLREETVAMQQRKREEQKKLREIEDKLFELRATAAQESKTLAEYNRTISDVWSRLRSTATIEIVEVEPRAMLKLPVGLLRIPWKDNNGGRTSVSDAERLNVLQSSFIPRGAHSPIPADKWQRIMRGCCPSSEELRMPDLIMHVMEYFDEDFQDEAL